MELLLRQFIEKEKTLEEKTESSITSNLKKLGEWLRKRGSTVALIIFFMFLVLRGCDRLMPRDDTDTSQKRSGMSLYTDNGTGCQYLGISSIFGPNALYPRMGRDGKQICNPVSK